MFSLETYTYILPERLVLVCEIPILLSGAPIFVVVSFCTFLVSCYIRILVFYLKKERMSWNFAFFYLLKEIICRTAKYFFLIHGVKVFFLVYKLCGATSHYIALSK